MSFEPYIRKTNTKTITNHLKNEMPIYDYTSRMIPAVTIPLGFLQQLIK